MKFTIVSNQHTFISNVNINMEKINTTLRRNLYDLIRDTTKTVIISHIPRKTGTLQKSVLYKVYTLTFGTLMGVITTRVPYAKYLEYGTKPHTIVPKRARALRFETEGKVIFVKKVFHPGVGNYMFFLKGYMFIKAKIGEYLKRGL